MVELTMFEIIELEIEFMGKIENTTITYAFTCSTLWNKVVNDNILQEPKKEFYFYGTKKYF